MITYWIVHSIYTALKYKTSCSSQPETDCSHAFVMYHGNPVIYDATESWLIWMIWNSCSFVFLLSQTFKKCGLNFKTLYVSQQGVDRIHQLKLFIYHCCKLLSGRGIEHTTHLSISAITTQLTIKIIIVILQEMTS